MTEIKRKELQLAADHPVFAGHFPKHPIVPGALLLDEVLRLLPERPVGSSWRCRLAKFVSPARPEQRLTIILEQAQDQRSVNFRIVSEDGDIASGMLQEAERPR